MPSISTFSPSIRFLILFLDNEKLFLFNTCFANVLSLIASVTHVSKRNDGISKSLIAREIFIGFVMSKISDLKPVNTSKLSSNIKLLKIIAITLGILIILGLFFLFWGLAKSYNNLEKNKIKDKSFLVSDDLQFSEFDFFQPKGSQLISSSLGGNNEILLRYLYQGNNVLVILNTEKKEVKSIITLKIGKDFGNKNK